MLLATFFAIINCAKNKGFYIEFNLINDTGYIYVQVNPVFIYATHRRHFFWVFFKTVIK